VSIDNFIPEIWASRLLSNLNKTLVFAQAGVVNRDYEGEITGVGDSVRINNIGRVTVRDYTKNTDIVTPDDLQDATQVLNIDQQKYFNFQIDDVDKVQQKPKVMNEAMLESAYALANVLDQYLAGLYTDADTANALGSDGSPKTDLATAGTAYEHLVDLGVVLDEANVPEDNRWAIVPPWYEGWLLKDQRFVSFGTAANRANLQNRQIGFAAGFNVMKSNNVTNNGGSPAVSRVMAGHPMAMSLAVQFTEMIAYRPEKRFGDAIKGLQVWGAKVVRSNALAVLYAQRA